jgi:hypothetical protein
MNTDNTQPVAWMVEWTDHADFFLHKPDAEMVAAGDMAVQSLYRAPQPTLTDAERTFLRMVRDTYAMQDDDEVCGMIAASITGLLERTK